MLTTCYYNTRTTLGIINQAPYSDAPGAAQEVRARQYPLREETGDTDADIRAIRWFYLSFQLLIKF